MRSFLNKALSLFVRKTTSSAWLPEVDGLRFLAICWVVLFHLQGSFLKKTSVAAGEANLVHRIFVGGDQGVLLFFMISGFILSLPFARYYELSEKKVSLLSYYLRRVIRIEPPYIIACFLIFGLLVAKHRDSFDTLLPHLGASLIYAHSLIYQETSLINVVFWSLEVEVQFYLLAPFLTAMYFYFTPKQRRTGAAVLLVILPFIQSFWPLPPLNIVMFIQYFLGGFVVCDLYVHQESGFFKMKSVLPWVLLVLMLVLNHHENSVENIALPFVMAGLFLFVLFHASWKKFFSRKLIAVIGGMCYSIYLIHFQIIAGVGDLSIRFLAGNNFYLNLFIQIVIVIPIVLAISAIFYIAVEKPFMGLRLTRKL